jgi:hypothetical protein
MSFDNSDTKIAGVTFNNPADEGGENRQVLLKQLYGGAPTPVTLENVIFHNPDTGLGEFAIKVRSDITHKLLGFIPKSEISKWNKTGKMMLVVEYYKNTYSGTLHVCKDPTPKQYGAMKSFVKKGLISKMPPYDQTVYKWAFNKIYGLNPQLTHEDE